MTTYHWPRRGALWVVLALAFLLVSTGAGVVSAAACTTTVPAPGDIQTAVTAAAPGDVICLTPGTYAPATTIVIDKALTIQGPQFGVDPRPSAGSARVPGGAAEALVDGQIIASGTVFQIEASDVVLDGFEVVNATGDMIASPAANAISGVVLRHLIVHMATGDEGIQIRNCAGCTIEYNYVYDTVGDGINLCCGSTNGLIQFNDVEDIDSLDAAIYVYGSTSSTIQCNVIDTTTNNDGIKLGAKAGTDAALTGGQILYNQVSNTAQDGISIYTSNVTISGNEVSGSTSENGAIYAAQGIADVAITYNYVHDNSLNPVKWTDPGAIMIGTGPNVATFTVSYNNIENNTVNGMTNEVAAVLVAENNWWGHPSGPSGAGAGSGDAVSSNIDFDPWLAEPAGIPPGPCISGGTITVVKQAGDVGDQFEFDPSWSDDNFLLYSGEAYVTNPPLPPGIYSVSEVNLPAGWSLDSATCDNEETDEVEDVAPSEIPVEDGDAWLCTFTNVYAPPPADVCPAEAAGDVWTDILGEGMGGLKKHRNKATIDIPNWQNVDELYGQMVAKDFGLAKYVRFILPGKNNFVQVNSITSPTDHDAGTFWYGDYLPAPSRYVTARWFLQGSGKKGHIPRAFVLYPTYQHPADSYVNVWDTFDAAEGEVHWDVSLGWTPYREIVVPIAAPQGATTLHVKLALADNDKDARPVWVTVEAGPPANPVSVTQMPAAPNAGDTLNLMTFTLPNVPAGTDEIVIKVYSPSPVLDGVEGDSASLVGMAAHYQCGPIDD